jgi:hypothetical protein
MIIVASFFAVIENGFIVIASVLKLWFFFGLALGYKSVF